MDTSYLMMLYVTLDQERVLKQFFIEHGWNFRKPDLSITTDKIGPSAMPVSPDVGPSYMPVSHAHKASHTLPASESSVIVNQTPSVSRITGKKRKQQTVTKTRSLLAKHAKSDVAAGYDASEDTGSSQDVLTKSANITFPMTVRCEDQEEIVVKLERPDDEEFEHIHHTYQSNKTDVTNNIPDKDTERDSDYGDNDDNSDNIGDDSFDAADQPGANSGMERSIDTKEDILERDLKQKTMTVFEQSYEQWVDKRSNLTLENAHGNCSDNRSQNESRSRLNVGSTKQDNVGGPIEQDHVDKSIKLHHDDGSIERGHAKEDDDVGRIASCIEVTVSKHEAPIYVCVVCNFKSIAKRDLKRHMNVHKKEKKNPSPVKDVRTIGKPHSSSNYRCSLCNYTTPYKHNLSRHSESHQVKQKEKSVYICEICGKKFQSKYAQTLHMKSIHLKIFKFNCAKCNKGFNQLYSYRGHLASHDGASREKCTVCSSAFRYQSSLKSHMEAVHGGVKFICSVATCESVFSSKKSLSEHTRGEHTNNRLKCDRCDLTYKWRSSLEYHKVHSHTD